MVDGDRENLKSVSPSQPCEVCRGDHKCSRGDVGLIMCGRKSGEMPGFVYLGQASRDPQFAMYRRDDDPRLKRNQERGASGPFKGRAGGVSSYGANGHHQQNGSAGDGEAVDWTAKAQACTRHLTPERRRELADDLGLAAAVLQAIPALGYMDTGPHRDPPQTGPHIGPCWTFPEQDGAGRIVGLVCRYKDGRKKVYPGAGRGLTIPTGWAEREGPVLLAEGPSDTLALTAMGLPAIGRPNNTGGVDHLAELFKDIPADRPIVVLGEYDPKPNGSWPGRDGAVKTAEALAAKLNRKTFWALPPAGAKDVRAWTVARKPDPTIADAWHDAGQEFFGFLQDKLQEAKPAAPADCPAFSWRPIDSATFARANYCPTWLVKRLLVHGQPAIVGGPKKTLKTSLLVDMAVSLASGTPFLGEFEVYRPVRVAVLSGESGEFTLQETAHRICHRRGIMLESIGGKLLWHFELPQLAKGDQLAALGAGLKGDRVEVLIFDPLYLALLSGQGPNALKAENLFDMGPLLMGVTKTCLNAGTTPALAHHTKRDSARKRDPLDLDDLAYAGIAEFARQWLLISRREEFEPGTGLHKLWLNAGGSAGQSGLWSVDIDEGVIDENFAGRKWDATVKTATEARKNAKGQRDRVKEESRARQDKEDDAKLLNAIDRLAKKGGVAGYTQARGLAGISGDRMIRAVERLIDGEIIERVKIKVPAGKGAGKPAEGLRRREKDHRSENDHPSDR